VQISIDDLKPEVHHRGCFITARTVTSAYVSTNLITIIEEEDGSVARLELTFQDPEALDAGIPEHVKQIQKSGKRYMLMGYCTEHGSNKRAVFQSNRRW
jgi:hypothetical protein